MASHGLVHGICVRLRQRSSRRARGTGIPFDEALSKIADAYGSVHPSMSSFVQMMGQRRWIDASSGPNKRPGAYCTSFRSLRQPRVYMTYTGAASLVITLAQSSGMPITIGLCGTSL